MFNSVNKLSHTTPMTDKIRKKTLCDYASCPPYARCVLHPQWGGNVPECKCNRRCPLRPKRICATNMREYLNTCHMEMDSCRSNMKFEVLKRGKCPAY